MRPGANCQHFTGGITTTSTRSNSSSKRENPTAALLLNIYTQKHPSRPSSCSIGRDGQAQHQPSSFPCAAFIPLKSTVDYLLLSAQPPLLALIRLKLERLARGIFVRSSFVCIRLFCLREKGHNRRYTTRDLL